VIVVTDDGRDVFGSGIATQDFPICDQYTIQGDVFSRAVRGDADVPVSLEDALKNIDWNSWKRRLASKPGCGLNGSWNR
jgi:hypothetical protein